MSYEESIDGDCPYCKNEAESNILVGKDTRGNYLVICNKCERKYYIKG